LKKTSIHQPPSVADIHSILPQTQCTRCGYPSCLAYAQAIVQEHAPINQCPPGGQQGIQKLAELTQQNVLELNPENGHEGPRTVAYIDEDWCIGCTLCIKACPTEAIMGANKFMHTVIEDRCTGCELCIPACPVDCIILEPVHIPDANGNLPTAWNAWNLDLASLALHRYEAKLDRIKQHQNEKEQQNLTTLTEKSKDLAAHSQITNPQVLDHKKKLIEMALLKAQQRLQK
jgi:electron transport complex protein RnfB